MDLQGKRGRERERDRSILAKIPLKHEMFLRWEEEGWMVPLKGTFFCQKKEGERERRASVVSSSSFVSPFLGGRVSFLKGLRLQREGRGGNKH